MKALSLAVLMLPCVAFGKGPTFGDLVSSLKHPAIVDVGVSYQVEATVDVPAYCARTQFYDPALCKTLAAEVLKNPLLTWVRRSYQPVTTPVHLQEMTVSLIRGTDGVYRGSLTPDLCQLEGPYDVMLAEASSAPTHYWLTVISSTLCPGDERGSSPSPAPGGGDEVEAPGPAGLGYPSESQLGQGCTSAPGAVPTLAPLLVVLLLTSRTRRRA